MNAKQAFVTVRTVAEMLGVSERTVRRWCDEGKFEFIQPGRFVLIRRTCVEAMIQPQQRTA